METCHTCQIPLTPNGKFLPRSVWSTNLRCKRKLSRKWQKRRIPSILLRKYLEQTCLYPRRRRRFPPRSTSCPISPFTIRPSSPRTPLRMATTRLWRSSLPTRRTPWSSLSARSPLRALRRNLTSNPHTTLNRHQWFPLLQTIETWRLSSLQYSDVCEAEEWLTKYLRCECVFIVIGFSSLHLKIMH